MDVADGLGDEVMERWEAAWTIDLAEARLAAEADRLFRVLLEETPWQQEYGPFRKPFPRLTSLHGDQGLTYTYSGVTYDMVPWTPELSEIRRRVVRVTGTVERRDGSAQDVTTKDLMDVEERALRILALAVVALAAALVMMRA